MPQFILPRAFVGTPCADIGTYRPIGLSEILKPSPHADRVERYHRLNLTQPSFPFTKHVGIQSFERTSSRDSACSTKLQTASKMWNFLVALFDPGVRSTIWQPTFAPVWKGSFFLTADVCLYVATVKDVCSSLRPARHLPTVPNTPSAHHTSKLETRAEWECCESSYLELPERADAAFYSLWASCSNIVSNNYAEKHS